jgi:hypothetical protein
MSLSSFIWSVTDLLRGDYKQSDYGKVNVGTAIVPSRRDQGRMPSRALSPNACLDHIDIGLEMPLGNGLWPMASDSRCQNAEPRWRSGRVILPPGFPQFHPSCGCPAPGPRHTLGTLMFMVAVVAVAIVAMVIPVIVVVMAEVLGAGEDASQFETRGLAQ